MDDIECQLIVNGLERRRPRLQRRVVQRRRALENQQLNMPALFRVEATLMQARMPALQSIDDSPALDVNAH
jgi:hypothetical protein